MNVSTPREPPPFEKLEGDRWENDGAKVRCFRKSGALAIAVPTVDYDTFRATCAAHGVEVPEINRGNRRARRAHAAAARKGK